MKPLRAVGAVAFALNAIFFQVTSATATIIHDSDIHTFVVTVTDVGTAEGSAGKDTAIVETSDGSTYDLPAEMDVPKAGMKIKVNVKGSQITSWHKATSNDIETQKEVDGLLDDCMRNINMIFAGMIIVGVIILFASIGAFLFH